MRKSIRESRLPKSGKCCERLCRDAFEDRLRVAVKQPGSSRYEQMKRQRVHGICRAFIATRVESRIEFASLAAGDGCEGFFSAYPHMDFDALQS